MRKLVFCIVLFALALIQYEAKAQCSCVENSNELSQAQLLLCENFESYLNGSSFPVNNSRWGLWPSTTPELAKIQSSPTSGNNKTLYVQRNGTIDPDLLLKLGNKTTGRYRLSWQMFIAKDKTAHYNIQHEENVTNGHWAFQVDFKSNGIGDVYLYSNTPVSSFPFLTGAWNTVMHIIDLDKDEIELWINNEFVDAWKFSLGNKGVGQISYGSKLGAVNFYADDGAEFYVDNICMWQKRSSIVAGVWDPVCVKNGESYTSPGAATNSLYTNNEYSRGYCSNVCDYWGAKITKLDPIIDEIPSVSFLPNQLLNDMCLDNYFQDISKKQIKGKIYSSNLINRNGGSEIEVTLKTTGANLNEVIVLLYDCDALRCFEPIEKRLDENGDGFIFRFDYESRSNPSIIVLTRKEIKYEISIKHPYVIVNSNCIDYPARCNCEENLIPQLKFNNSQRISFNNFKYPVNTYKDFNIDLTFEGSEAMYYFILEKPTLVSLSVIGSGNGIGLFLYGAECGFDAIASATTSVNGGTASIDKFLQPGRYHIFLDLMRNATVGIVTLGLKEGVEINNEVDAQSCSTDNSKKHLITIRGNPLLLENTPLSISDRILTVSYGTEKKVFKSANWNGQEVVFDINADDPKQSGVCGFLENEEMHFEIIRGNTIIPVKPVFQVDNQLGINANTYFKNGGKSLITGFYSDKGVAYIGIETFPKITSAATQFFTELTTNDDWFIRSSTLNSSKAWYTIEPTSGEKGAQDIIFTLTKNPYTHSRRDTLSIIDAKGNIKLVVLEQPGCTGPSVNAGPDQTYCSNQDISLTATGNGTISWRTTSGNTIASGSRLNTRVTSTQTFMAIATLNGCTATDEVTITVASNLKANAGPDQSICAGAQAILTASGGDGYSWSNGRAGAQIPVSPTQTTTYTVTVSQNGCQATDQVVVNVSRLIPTVSPDQIICAGTSTVLQASGGTAYRWSNLATSSSITVSPGSSQVYGVTVSNNGCSGEASVFVTVLSPPSISVSSTQTICEGQSVLLSARGSGNYTYRWSNNDNRAETTVAPSSTTIYTVNATNGGCTTTANVTVLVRAKPNANAGQDQNICAGAQATLTASGGDSYSWSTGRAGAQILVSPTQTTTYTVTVSQNGCQATDQVVVNVGRLVANVSPAQTICAGNSVTLQANGGSTYRWSTLENGSSISVKPASSQTYGVTVSNSTGCSTEALISVTVLPIPNVSINPIQPICEGQSVLLVANGSGTFRWSNEATATTAQIRVGPTSSTTYTVTASQNGCSNTASITVLVKSKPLANAGPDKSICQGIFTTLSASGGGTYRWSTGESMANINVSPGSTQNYRLTVTQNGCESTDSVTVTVYPKPTITLIDSRLVFGPTGYLKVDVRDGTPSYRYTWFRNDTAISNQKDLFGLRTGIYKLVATDARGCSATFGPQVIITTSTVDPSITTNIRLFPNPSNGIIHLQFDLDQSTALEVNILDGVGKTIWRQSQRHFFRETLDLDLSKHPAGMYWIQFKTESGTFYKKLLRL